MLYSPRLRCRLDHRNLVKSSVDTAAILKTNSANLQHAASVGRRQLGDERREAADDTEEADHSRQQSHTHRESSHGSAHAHSGMMKRHLGFNPHSFSNSQNTMLTY